MNTRDLNETLRSLNVGLPDDVERLKAAGYYEEAIARIDAYLAEDWTMTQNSPYSQGLCPHMDVQPENPTPPRGGRSAGRYDRPAGDHAADPGGVHLEQGGRHCRDAAPGERLYAGRV